jgi:aliphatic nitrilase
MSKNQVVLAAVQAAPVFLDRAASVEKAIGLIEQAARSGAQLVGFPENWIPGYPWWIWLGAPAWGMQFMARYHQNAMRRDGPEMAAIAAAARRNGIVVVMGHVERDGGSLYMAQCIIDADGRPLLHRRKLKPSRTERMIFGEGDGSHLSVVDTRVGRVGALCCWEHIQPLSKYAMFTQGEQIHVAAWPALSLYRGKAYAPGPEMSMAISQVYAAEGQCFVVAPTTVMDTKTLDMVCDTPEKRAMLTIPEREQAGGSSMIFGPDGKPLAAYIPEDQEGIVMATADFDAILAAKVGADPVGHYARPDVLRLMINRQPAPSVVRFGATYEPAAPDSADG